MQSLITSVSLLVALLMISFMRPCLAQTTPAAPATSAGSTYKLTVVLSDVDNRTGKLYIGLSNSAETFSGESSLRKVVAVPASGDVSVTFDSVVAGRYAVRIYQDLNDNGKMDFSGQMPAEPFGFSNVTMLMGPPSFEQCAFDLKGNQSIKVGLLKM